MKELTYFRINVRCVLYSLGHKELIKLIPSNLSKLDVVCEGVRTNLVISMGRLKNIKILRIGEGLLKFVKDVTPAPVELQLKNVFFLKNRKFLSVNVNSLFDFRNLQILRLDCSETQNMELDLAGNINLKSLILENVKISNWESSNWTVKDLTLGENMNFRTATGIKFDQLDYRSKVIDIALLPNSLKSLTLRKLKTKILNIEVAHNLKDLQCLILHRNKFSILSNFHRCPKLTHLHLIPDESLVIDLGLIPKTLKVFRLSGDCELTGTTDAQFDTVMIEHIGFLKSFHIASEVLKTKNAFVYSSSFEFAPKHCVADLMEGFFQKYFVGPFLKSKDDEFSFFFFPDNRKAEYLIKKDAVVTEEIGQIETERIKDNWWKSNLRF